MQTEVTKSTPQRPRRLSSPVVDVSFVVVSFVVSSVVVSSVVVSSVVVSSVVVSSVVVSSVVVSSVVVSSGTCVVVTVNPLSASPVISDVYSSTSVSWIV